MPHSFKKNKYFPNMAVSIGKTKQYAVTEEIV